MASEINPAVFPDNIKVDKADLREQFQIAKNEITALQEATSLANQLAFSDTSFDEL